MVQAFDYAILSWYHSLAEAAGDFFTPIAKFITLIGENGIWLFVLSGILMCFAKTRKIGICLFGAVSCGTLITTFTLKDIVQRIRPYIADGTYKEWWMQAGMVIETDFSFPSGHVTAAAAGMTALALAWDKKALWFGAPYVLLMCASRNYLMAHYPTDVLAGACVGIISAVIAYLITLGIYAFLEKYKKNAFCRFILTDFDAGKLFRSKK